MGTRLAIAMLTASMLAPAWASPLQAQRRAVPVIVVPPLTAVAVNDLSFGVVTAGTPKAPTSLASDAGRFTISGQPSTPVTVSFTLPTVLTGAGNATIPITFGSSDGLFWHPYPGTFSTFSPSSASPQTLDATGSLVIGISGTVSPPTLTSTGLYTGTITLTVSY